MLNLLKNLLITPIEYIIELVYSVMLRALNVKGLAIICVSIAVQILVFPLYKKADSIQEKERQRQKSLEKWVRHIRKTFTGNERFMMTQAYYREQHYKPIYALKGSISLLLQVPFFIAAYDFLSNLRSLEGSSFFFIADLSQPDRLLSIGGFAINVLPILMTVINILSGMIYTKGFPLREKIQLYAMAGLFLVLLYGSPSGLVLYWTINNLFSLLKNIVTKYFRNTRLLVSVCSAAAGLVLFLHSLRVILGGGSIADHWKLLVFAIVILPLSLVPCALILFRKKHPVTHAAEKIQENGHSGKKQNVFFFLGGAFLSLFIGAYVPLTVISSSPVEFLAETYGPLDLVANVLSVSIGFFIILAGVFYFLSDSRGKRAINTVYFVLALVSVSDFLLFNRDFGTLSILMVFDKTPAFSVTDMLLGALSTVIAAFAGVILMRKKPAIAKYVYAVLLSVVLVLSVMDAVKVRSEISHTQIDKEDAADYGKVLHLSRDGDNVILIMLDRGISCFIPYIFNEKPELYDSFTDFIYYPNTVSFGSVTIFGSPSLFGGYEYTPWAMDQRADTKLADKHNEALSVLPVLFSESGYEVTVCDPPLAGYQWIPDLSIYDGYDGISAYALNNAYTNYAVGDDDYLKRLEPVNSRCIFFYSLMKVIPVPVQRILYDDGRYWNASNLADPNFLGNYSELYMLPEITEIDESGDRFLMIQNSLPHEPATLSLPDYVLSADGSGLRDPKYRTDAEGNTIDLSSEISLSHYHVNMASVLFLASWFDYLKENGVYDNTRIIICSDHGHHLGHVGTVDLGNGKSFDLENYNPLLLFKDFNTDGNADRLKVDYTFMTQADCPTLAVEGLLEDPVNPFTGNAIDNSEKSSGPQKIAISSQWHLEQQDGNEFELGNGFWVLVHDNIFDRTNWELLEE